MRVRTQRRLGSSQQPLHSRFLFLTAKSLPEKHAHLQTQALQLTARSSNETLNLKVLPLTTKDAHYKNLFSKAQGLNKHAIGGQRLFGGVPSQPRLCPKFPSPATNAPYTHSPLTKEPGPFTAGSFQSPQQQFWLPANRCSLPLAFFSNNSTFLKESTVLAPKSCQVLSHLGR